MKKIGRNEPCPCGSGKKYKKCCLPKEEQAKAEERASQEAEILARAMREEQDSKELSELFEDDADFEDDGDFEYDDGIENPFLEDEDLESFSEDIEDKDHESPEADEGILDEIPPIPARSGEPFDAPLPKISSN